MCSCKHRARASVCCSKIFNPVRSDPYWIVYAPPNDSTDVHTDAAVTTFHAEPHEGCMTGDTVPGTEDIKRVHQGTPL